MNVALVGYGLAGRFFHAPLISSVEGLCLAAVVSSDAEKVHADLADASVVTFDAALADPSIGLVVIATPNATHFDLAARALARGKHVVVDKPFTLTADEAREIFAQAARAERIATVFHNRRWDSDFLTLRRLMAEGGLGEVTHFESHFDRYRPVVQDRWRERAGAGSGLWFDLGPHLADQALQLFGPPQSVFADLAIQRDGAVTTDYFHVLLRYPRLRAILRASSMAAAPSPRFTVHGTRASFVKFGLDAQEDALRAGRKPGGADWGLDSNAGTLIKPDGAHDVISERGDWRRFYVLLRDAILGRGPLPVTSAEAIDVMRVLELAERSAAARAEMPWTD